MAWNFQEEEAMARIMDHVMISGRDEKEALVESMTHFFFSRKDYWCLD